MTEEVLTAEFTGTVDQIADLAREGTEAEQLQPGGYYAFRLRDRVHEIDLTGERYQDRPRRKVGTVRVTSVQSFTDYWLKHSAADISEVYADRAALTVTAVLDAHGAPADATGWGQHRLVLTLKHSAALRAWLDADGRLMPQEAFAEFLDDNRADIHSPPAAEMLEIAQTIEGTSKVDWQAGHRLVDGQRRIGYIETNTARAGQKGELAIPTVITIHVPVFDRATQAHELEARFRHRIDSGSLKLGFKLARPGDVVTSAFDHTVSRLAIACGATVMWGTPAGRGD
jgi:uncharacterized protein YfdQ (DUF2303 family)